MSSLLPRLLVIDDLFGRNVLAGRNTAREDLCVNLLLRDETGDTATQNATQRVVKPIAEAVFFRGQSPQAAQVGDSVGNDLTGSLAMVRAGWQDCLTRGEAPWSMVLLDLCFYTGQVTAESARRTVGMPEGNAKDDVPGGYFGLMLLDKIHSEFPDLPIFILSSKSREEVSLEFSKLGALGFISRDDPNGRELLREAIWQHGLLPDESGKIIGNSLPVLLTLREARRAARHRGNLLLRGERGSGKELLASYVHRVSGSIAESGTPAMSGPFVPVNSAAFTTDLFSSELFGIAPRSASGVDGKLGLIEAAHQGDLFLDEIADMPLAVQATMLRVLQDGKVTPVGSRAAKQVDVRFLSATNVDLESDPRRFRQDLLDRLRAGGTLWLPPLRDRKTDIPLLVSKFVRDAESARPGTRKREVTPEAIQVLIGHEWPGNIRELRSCLFDAVNRFPDVEFLVPSHLRINRDLTGGREQAAPIPDNTMLPKAPIKVAGHLAELMDCISRTTFEQQKTEDWAGQLPALQVAQARLAARYLQAALEATKRCTPQNPQGLLQIHPAIKLMTGDSALTATRSADLIKRLLAPIETELVGDLREAFDTALRLRPRSSKSLAST